MNKKVILLIIGVTLLAAASTGTAAKLSGNLYTEFYSYESQIPDTNSHLRSHQGFRLNVSDAFIPGLTVFANGRVASDISTKLSTDPDYRVFGAYLQYQPKSRKFAVRAGRQFVYEGLGGFILDGGKLKADMGKYVSAAVFAGTIPGPSFFVYDQVNKWDRRNAIGGRVNIKATEMASFNLSYLQKSINDLLDSRLIGVDYLCKRSRFSQRLRVDYDLYFERLKYISYSPQYKYAQGHSVRMEYAYRKPSFGINNIFSVVKSNSIHQVRMNGTFKVDEQFYSIGAVSYTKYSEKSNLSLRAGANYKGHTGGVVYSSGYGGSKVGIFGGLRYSVSSDLSLYGNIDMYNLKLDTDDEESESSMAAALGGRYKISSSFNARAEIQILTNPLYDYDTRGYLRIDYSIFKEIRGIGQEGGDAR